MVTEGIYHSIAKGAPVLGVKEGNPQPLEKHGVVVLGLHGVTKSLAGSSMEPLTCVLSARELVVCPAAEVGCPWVKKTCLTALVHPVRQVLLSAVFESLSADALVRLNLPVVVA